MPLQRYLYKATLTAQVSSVASRVKSVFSSECVKVPMPGHQVLSLAAYIFKASYCTPATQTNKIQSMDQSELLNLWAGVGTLPIV